MKIRNGFVSNSSSSSFILALPWYKWNEEKVLKKRLYELFEGQSKSIQDLLVYDIIRGYKMSYLYEFFDSLGAPYHYNICDVTDPNEEKQEIDNTELDEMEYRRETIEEMKHVFEVVSSFYERNIDKDFVLIGRYRYEGLGGSWEERYVAEHYKEIFRDIPYLVVE